MSLRIDDLIQNKRRVRNVKSIPQREVLPLKQVKTFTAYLTKDIKIRSQMQLTAIGAKTLYAVDLEKGDKVSVTEFFDGETFYMINGQSWYLNELNKKRELKEVQEGKKDPPKNFGSSLMFFYKYGLGKNPSAEQIQEKIDEPIKRPFSFSGAFSYGGNKEAIFIKKNDFALNRETAMNTEKSSVVNEVKFGDPLKNKKWLVYGLIAVAGYFAYKKLK
jgi:hypothetical protein